MKKLYFIILTVICTMGCVAASSMSMKFAKDGPQAVSESNTKTSGIASLQQQLKDYVSDKDARIGVAVIVDGKDTVEVNGRRDFPMLSVYKFPQALAVADYCSKHGLSLNDSINIPASEILPDTWSPMRDKYGVKDLRLPLFELLEYSLQQSDNNACDVLFHLIGGPRVADSLMKAEGFNEIHVVNTEKEMHDDVYRCYRNRATPLDMARLFDRFYRLGMKHCSPAHEAIGDIMLSCNTGNNRLSGPLMTANAMIAHKTGTGDTNSQGRLIGINDAGFIWLPNKRSYAIAVFVADSAYGIPESEQIIADISKIVFTAL